MLRNVALEERDVFSQHVGESPFRSAARFGSVGCHAMPCTPYEPPAPHTLPLGCLGVNYAWYSDVDSIRLRVNHATKEPRIPKGWRQRAVVTQEIVWGIRKDVFSTKDLHSYRSGISPDHSV